MKSYRKLSIISVFTVKAHPQGQSWQFLVQSVMVGNFLLDETTSVPWSLATTVSVGPVPGRSIEFQL